MLDQRAGLIAIEPRHHDVDEHDVGLMIGDLGECVEAVDRRVDLAAFLRQQGLGGAPDRLAVVDDKDLQALERRNVATHPGLTPLRAGFHRLIPRGPVL